MQLDFLAALLRRRPAKIEKPSEAPELLAQAQALLHGVGARALAERVAIRWNRRMRSTAGTASPAKCLVTLNPALQAFGEAEVDRTLRHELAHLLAHFRAGRRRIAPHGPEWRQACHDLGLIDETRCHQLPLPRQVRQRRHAYSCPACGTILRRVRPLRRRMACLACCRKHSRGQYDERFRFIKVEA